MDSTKCQIRLYHSKISNPEFFFTFCDLLQCDGKYFCKNIQSKHFNFETLSVNAKYWFRYIMVRMCMCTHIHTYVCTFKMHQLIIRGDILCLKSVEFWLLTSTQSGFCHQAVCLHSSFSSRIHLSPLPEHTGYTLVGVMLSVMDVLDVGLQLTP